jgi:hypothetical protein
VVHHHLVGLFLSQQDTHFARVLVFEQFHVTNTTLLPLFGVGCKPQQLGTTGDDTHTANMKAKKNMQVHRCTTRQDS